MREVTLPSGEELPALGLGTWHMAEQGARRRDEMAAVRLALECGYRLFDTAEMYAEGGAEKLLGEALNDALRAGDVAREDLTVVSKVYPHNASRQGAVAACERSLRRLGLDTIDLYLLHWPGAYPLAETIEAFEDLQRQGRIRHWGVSNFDLDELQALAAAPGGSACSVNQVYYSLSQRGAGFDLAPWQRVRQIPLMSYSPIDQGALARSPKLAQMAAARGITPAQLALAWLLDQPGVMAIPKAVKPEHVRANIAAADVELSADERAEIDRLFPAPKRKTPLAML